MSKYLLRLRRGKKGTSAERLFAFPIFQDYQPISSGEISQHRDAGLGRSWSGLGKPSGERQGSLVNTLARTLKGPLMLVLRELAVEALMEGPEGSLLPGWKTPGLQPWPRLLRIILIRQPGLSGSIHNWTNSIKAGYSPCLDIMGSHRQS